MNGEHNIPKELDAFTPRAVSDATLDRVRRSVSERTKDAPRRRLSLRLIGTLAAAACLAIGVSLFWNPGTPTVPDPFEGAVALDSGWRILPIGDADYTADTSDTIRLTRGELRIASARDDADPLTITTDAGQAIARGTDFYIGAHTPTPLSTEAPAMKRLTRILVLTGVVTLTNPLGSVTGNAHDLLAAEAEQAPTKITLKASNDFAFDLFKQLSEENGGKNLFVSPYSISGAMAMATEGARGNTAEQMGDALAYPDAMRRTGDDAQRIPWRTSLIHTGFGELNKRFNAEGKPYQLAVANAMWGEQTYPIRDEFIKTISDSYDTGGMFLADFIKKPEAERKRINTWVEDHTNDRIKDLLPEGSIDGYTRLVLTNAIFFKGDWAIRFKEKATYEGDFTRADGSKVKTKIMVHNEIEFPFASFDAQGKSVRVGWKLDPTGFQIASLPYKGDALSMLVVAPNDPKNLPAIEANLNAESLDAWTKQMRKTEVNLTLPKFKMETSYNLIPTLKAMGITDAFEGGVANFNGISPSAKAEGLYIGTVRHKAFVEINEEGTEAAAATAIEFQDESARLVPSLRADRPFLFFIRDNQSGAILFMGRMMDPTAK